MIKYIYPLGRFFVQMEARVMAEKKFSIGEMIVYGSVGVVKIIDIREECITDTPREYYVLCDVCSRADSQIFVPTDNEKLVSTMRKLISREEAEALLAIPESELPKIEWKRDSRARMEYFRGIIESGDHKTMIAMINAIRRAGEARHAEGKKNFLSDENMLHKAEQLLDAEFNIVLGRTE